MRASSSQASSRGLGASSSQAKRRVLGSIPSQASRQQACKIVRFRVDMSAFKAIRRPPGQYAGE